MKLELLKNCPVCQGEKYRFLLSCIDYTVSKETFDIVACENCAFEFTNPRPDQESIGRYYQSTEYISHSNTNKGIINKLYQTVRKQTLQRKLDLVISLEPAKGELLDIGCGTGAFLQVCKQAGWLTNGIETDEAARALAMQISNSPIEADLLTYQSFAQFNIITMWHVLEHIHRLDESIQKIKSLLKANGRLCIAVPNSKSHDAQKYQKYWAAYDVPRHLYHFSQTTIRQLFNRHALEVEQVLPMKYDAYYISMLSSKYKSGKVKYLEAVWEGAQSNQWAAKNGNNYSSLIYIIKHK